jgi:hypothetical protein
VSALILALFRVVVVALILFGRLTLWFCRSPRAAILAARSVSSFGGMSWSLVSSRSCRLLRGPRIPLRNLRGGRYVFRPRLRAPRLMICGGVMPLRILMPLRVLMGLFRIPTRLFRSAETHRLFGFGPRVRPIRSHDLVRWQAPAGRRSR